MTDEIDREEPGEGRSDDDRADQAWYWTERWQEREREVDEHVERGETTTYETSDDFLFYLESGEGR